MCLWLQFKTDTDKETFKKFFQEVQQAVDSKQLRPMIRTQYNRAAFQVPFDATVRISLDTNLAMIKENTDGQPVGLLHRSAFWPPLCCLPFVCYLLLFACCLLAVEARFRAKLDTKLAMIQENTDGQPVGLLHRSAFWPPLCCLHLLFAVCLLYSCLGGQIPC